MLSNFHSINTALLIKASPTSALSPSEHLQCASPLDPLTPVGLGRDPMESLIQRRVTQSWSIIYSFYKYRPWNR